MRTLSRTLIAVSLLTLAGLALAIGYRAVRADVRASLYEERLQALSEDYESLRSTYNTAVRRTAITELHVASGTLCVRVRDAEGVQKTIETPFDPTGEVYVDYVVHNGRVWVRRVFDEHTAPSEAMVIDPVFADVDWDDERSKLGKAVYRALSEGRWVITVTGDGSLGLVKSEEDDPAPDLIAAPEVRDFDEIDHEVDATIRDATPGDLWRALVGN